jgi:hypothetical protein
MDNKHRNIPWRPVANTLLATIYGLTGFECGWISAIQNMLIVNNFIFSKSLPIGQSSAS